MDRRLQTLAATQYGVFSAADAARVGVSPDELATLSRRREIVRVRRGAYVLSNAFAVAEPSETYLLRVRAVLRTRPKQDRASHQSALPLLGIGSYDVPSDVIAVETRQVTRRRVRAGLATHPWTGGDTWSRGEFRSVSPAVACAQVALVAGFVAAVCAMDSAQHLGLCTRAELHEAATTIGGPRTRTIERAILASDPDAESVGESRTRIILTDGGFSMRSQEDLRDDDGFIGRVDFLVDDCVIVEFDGMVKYSGTTGQAALAREKIREDRLRRRGYEVERVIWGELDDPVSLVLRIEHSRRVARERRSARERVRT
ncbi:MAG: type IV toxin-antitoxin system AbiEi family antitoxin domain-containing protein [Dermatophilaceae bacterium]|nr:type IV toxin-antitoxin system AbiEi family antitoxin domain-containing protein [Intrasporangiaceae bacterium]